MPQLKLLLVLVVLIQNALLLKRIHELFYAYESNQTKYSKHKSGVLHKVSKYSFEIDDPTKVGNGSVAVVQTNSSAMAALEWKVATRSGRTAAFT